MMDRFRGRQMLFIIFIMTALGFSVWVGLLYVVWRLLPGIGWTNVDFFAMISALSTAVAAAGVFAAGYVAYRELSEVANSRYMEVADRLFNELNSAENIEARRWIYQNLPSDAEEGMQRLTPEGQAAMKRVLNSLDRVAFLTQSGWIPEDLVMPWMQPMIIKSWQKLEPYVVYERKRRHEPYYYEYAGDLASRCLDWRAKNRPEADIQWLGDAL